MKSASKKKNNPANKTPEDKFVAGQKYTDRGTIFDDDPNLDVPEFVNEEEELLSDAALEETNPLNKTEENENI